MHAEELKALGITITETHEMRKSFGTDAASYVGLAITIEEAINPGGLRRLVLFLRDLLVSKGEILRLRLDEPEEITNILRAAEERKMPKKVEFVARVQKGAPRFSFPSGLFESLGLHCGDIVIVSKLALPKGTELHPGEVKITSGRELYIRRPNGARLKTGMKIRVQVSLGANSD